MASDSLCRGTLLRCGIYAADCRPEKYGPDGGIFDLESGECIFRAGRLGNLTSDFECA